LVERFVRVTRAAEIAAGGMKAFTIEGDEIVVGNCGGTFYAVSRRCGHMHAPLEMGTLDGTILTCPTHCAQFDVTTGEVLCGPMPHYLGKDPLPANAAQRTEDMGLLMRHVRTESLRTYATKAESGWILVAVDQEAAAVDD
jgi:3-phenylpropionate/trans-cinnamate dioxygenase ferredoxin subunit